MVDPEDTVALHLSEREFTAEEVSSFLALRGRAYRRSLELGVLFDSEYRRTYAAEAGRPRKLGPLDSFEHAARSMLNFVGQSPPPPDSDAEKVFLLVSIAGLGHDRIENKASDLMRSEARMNAERAGRRLDELSSEERRDFELTAAEKSAVRNAQLRSWNQEMHKEADALAARRRFDPSVYRADFLRLGMYYDKLTLYRRSGEDGIYMYPMFTRSLPLDTRWNYQAATESEKGLLFAFKMGGDRLHNTATLWLRPYSSLDDELLEIAARSQFPALVDRVERLREALQEGQDEYARLSAGFVETHAQDVQTLRDRGYRIINQRTRWMNNMKNFDWLNVHAQWDENRGARSQGHLGWAREVAWTNARALAQETRIAAATVKMDLVANDGISPLLADRIEHGTHVYMQKDVSRRRTFSRDEGDLPSDLRSFNEYLTRYEQESSGERVSFTRELFLQDAIITEEYMKRFAMNPGQRRPFYISGF